MATSHVTVKVLIQKADDPERWVESTSLVRGDITTMEPGLRRNAAFSIVTNNILQQFWGTYNAACAPPDEVDD